MEEYSVVRRLVIVRSKRMILKKKNQVANKNDQGFTLVELAVVILITGILMIPLVQLYASYVREQRVLTTKENIENASRILALSSTIRYPCPSDRSLPRTNANYGIDVCTIPGFTLAGIPNCVANGNNNGICKTPGARDTTDDSDLTAGNNNEFVLIGGVPLSSWNSSLGIKETFKGMKGDYATDGWGNKLDYAVSYTSSRPNRLDGFTRFKHGVIRVVDEWGQTLGGTDSAGVNKDAQFQFIIISHGENGIGAYTSAGGRRACTATTVEGENCDADSTFVQSIAHSNGTRLYDDYSYTQSDESGNLWDITRDMATQAPSAHIQSIPTGIVGINTTTPGDRNRDGNQDFSNTSGIDLRLDVNGGITADTVRTNEICAIDGTNCVQLSWSDSLFGQKKTSGANQNDCAANEVVISISGGKVTCGKADIQPSGAVNCPAGTWITQIRTDGSIICTDNRRYCPSSITPCTQ